MPFATPTAAPALTVSRPVVRTFTPRPHRFTTMAASMISGFLTSFGLPQDERLLAAGGGNTFSDMGAELLRGLPRPLSRVDVLALAFHTPDLDVVKVAGCALAEHCDGRPDVFSVSGQGAGAPFTALRVLAGLRAASGSERSALFVFDQTTLPYPEPDVHGRGRDNCAVLLHTDPRSGPESARLVFTDERPVDGAREARAALDGVWRHAAVPGTGPVRDLGPARFVLGSTLAGFLPPHSADRGTGQAGHGAAADDGLVMGSGRHLCTSAWAALAQSWPAGGLPDDRVTVVADYDPHACRLFQAGFLAGGAR